MAKNVGEEILLCQELLAQARALWIEVEPQTRKKYARGVAPVTYKSVMSKIRRVAGNCVRVMEVHGTGDKKR